MIQTSTVKWLLPPASNAGSTARFKGPIVSPPEAAARYKLSDHCPIFVDLEVPAGDDKENNDVE